MSADTMTDNTTPEADEGFLPFDAPGSSAADQGTESAPAAESTAPDLADAVTRDDETGDIDPSPEKDDIERLLGEPNGPFKLTSGTEVKVSQLRLREFLRLLRIVTRGASINMAGMRANFESPEDFVQTFVAMVLFAVPEAEYETVEFLQTICVPADSGPDKRSKEAAELALRDELDNPELEDVINIITAVVASEARDLQALGKRLTAMFKAAQKMGLAPNLGASD